MKVITLLVVRHALISLGDEQSFTLDWIDQLEEEVANVVRNKTQGSDNVQSLPRSFAFKPLVYTHQGNRLDLERVLIRVGAVIPSMVSYKAKSLASFLVV